MKSVFLIDDHTAFRTGLKMMLEMWPGIVVAGESSGKGNFLNQLLTLKPDLIFIDVHLRGSSSFSYIAAIHALFPDSKIILLSMFAEQGYLDDGEAAGACAVLFKPTLGETLVNTMKKIFPDEFVIDDKIMADNFQNQVDLPFSDPFS